MTPFETLSLDHKRAACAQRFKLTFESVAAAQEDALLRAWRENAPYGNPNLLTDPNAPIKEAIQAARSQPPGIDEKAVNLLIDAKVDPVKGRVVGLEERTTNLEKLLDKVKAQVPTVVKLDKPNQSIIDCGVQHRTFPTLLKLIGLKLNVWLAGPAGGGKSRGVAEAAKFLDRELFRISCGPQTPASQVFGHTTATGGYAPGIAYLALKSPGALLLLDEFDRMNPAVAVMANGLLDGGAVTFPNGETLTPSPNTTYIVAANTFGKPTAEFGTANRQDASTMSRFVRVSWEVDEALESALFGRTDWTEYVQKVRKVTQDLGVTSMVITPRASEYGTILLKSGIDREVVEEMTLWSGVPKEDQKKVRGALGL